MKKIAITILVVLGMVLNASAQLLKEGDVPSDGGSFGLFQSGDGDRGLFDFLMPEVDSEEDNPAFTNDAPIGGGTLLLIGLGAAYAMGKKRRKE